MAVPYSNRTAIFTIPALSIKDKRKLSVSCTELLEDLVSQFPDLKDDIECFLWLSNNKVRVTLKTPQCMENFLSRGATFRTHPLTMRPFSVTKHIRVLRLTYGIPNADIVTALSPFGKVSAVMLDSEHGIHVGSRTVIMTVDTDIPCQMNIWGHSCLFFYRGQRQVG